MQIDSFYSSFISVVFVFLNCRTKLKGNKSNSLSLAFDIRPVQTEERLLEYRKMNIQDRRYVISAWSYWLSSNWQLSFIYKLFLHTFERAKFFSVGKVKWFKSLKFWFVFIFYFLFQIFKTLNFVGEML